MGQTALVVVSLQVNHACPSEKMTGKNNSIKYKEPSNPTKFPKYTPPTGLTWGSGSMSIVVPFAPGTENNNYATDTPQDIKFFFFCAYASLYTSNTSRCVTAHHQPLQSGPVTALLTTMGSNRDHKCIVYGSTGSSEEQYHLGIPKLTVFEDLRQSVHLDMLWAASSFLSLLFQLFLPVSTMYYKARMGFNTGITYLPLLHLLSNKFLSSTRSGPKAVEATGVSLDNYPLFVGRDAARHQQDTLPRGKQKGRNLVLQVLIKEEE
ncbi:hypothetical protein PROFUN_15010 [Planoprotostelium fungivorum]|uniref:Uncharacterized protein n=1 Tax=Planoprotostelium fungivorum TaxID=1890364 RepID=A0A2P6MY13_9EUKA|nr:hypothetical protein PROFUN_15010 [Planoprotostelium fungivorum]